MLFLASSFFWRRVTNCIKIIRLKPAMTIDKPNSN
ncbi:hypothetical protein MED222_06070 [Vibrio sp. MED222]|nr:hypothetical protein MED222_06070 [Vibrio sp. MED222]